MISTQNNFLKVCEVAQLFRKWTYLFTLEWKQIIKSNSYSKYKLIKKKNKIKQASQAKLLPLSDWYYWNVNTFSHFKNQGGSSQRGRKKRLKFFVRVPDIFYSSLVDIQLFSLCARQVPRSCLVGMAWKVFFYSQEVVILKLYNSTLSLILWYDFFSLIAKSSHFGPFEAKHQKRYQTSF